MLTRFFIAITALLGAGFTTTQAQILPNFGGQRAGLSTLSFLKNDLNPRSTGMSGASIANTEDGFSAKTNPAALAKLKENTLGLSHLMVGAGIQQSFASYQHKLKNEATVGLSVNSLNSGDMMVRTEFQPDGTGQYFSMSQNALTANYATRLSDMFSLGIGLNYIYETMQTYNNSTASIDLGFLYQTDFKNLRFAVVVQNFGGNSTLSGTSLQVDYNRAGNPELGPYSLPTVFKMGFAFDAYKKGKNLIVASAQLNNPNDNAENIRLGFEYQYTSLLSVQTGYKISVKGQSYPSLGFQYRSRIGVHPLHINYGMNPTNYMGTQHVFGVQISLNKMERA
ncbi:MAG: PorV/PorQ family protein [Bacteroidia bacterium]|nr:PorV/PorQ family protein [Bacteroidia bacterium]